MALLDEVNEELFLIDEAEIENIKNKPKFDYYLVPDQNKQLGRIYFHNLRASRPE